MFSFRKSVKDHKGKSKEVYLMFEVLENGYTFICVETNLDCGSDIYDDSDYCGCDIVVEPDTNDDDICTD